MRKITRKRRRSGRRPSRRAGAREACELADHERVSEVLEAARFGIWDWDARTGTVQCSGNVAEIFGFEPKASPSPEELLARIHPDDRELAVRPALSGAFQIEYRIVLPEGGLRWVASRGFIHCDEAGRPVRRLAALFDITPLKVSQETALHVKEKLERRVARRTALLQDLVRQLEAFSFSVSHDIRAPLRAMVNYADLAQRYCAGRVDPQALEYLEKISAAAARLEQLTHDLLRFSRLSKVPPAVAPVALGPIIAELMEEYPSLEANRACFQVLDVRGVARGNESLVRQVLSNLLENAVKFRDAERPLIVKVWTKEEAGRIMIFVQDNGIGIEPRHHDRVFRPFERLQREEPGTGMGLAIAKRAVELMDGRVGFESEPGKGSTFWVELPKA